MKLTDQQSKLYHSHTIRNMDEIQRSKKCGCIACCRIYSPDIVEEGIEEQKDKAITALCPYCSCDSIIGDASGLGITPEILEDLNQRWFGD